MLTVRVQSFPEVGLAAVAVHTTPRPLPAAVRVVDLALGAAVARLALGRPCGPHACCCRQNVYRHLDLLIERARIS